MSSLFPTIGPLFIVVGTCLIVPSSIGIAQYNKADAVSKKNIKGELIAQIVILVLSVLLLVTGVGMTTNPVALAKLRQKNMVAYDAQPGPPYQGAY